MQQLLSLACLAGLVGTEGFATEVKPVACGPSCLSMVCRLNGHPLTDQQLRAVLGADLHRETSLRELAEAAHELGLSTRAVSLDPGNPALAPLPMIARFKGLRGVSENHFVVLLGRSDDGIQVIDYPGEPRRFPVETIARHWDGIGLYVVADADDVANVPGESVSPYGSIVFIASMSAALCAVGLVVSCVRRTRPALPRAVEKGNA